MGGEGGQSFVCGYVGDSLGNWIGSYKKREERSTKDFSNRFVVAVVDAWTSVCGGKGVVVRIYFLLRNVLVVEGPLFSTVFHPLCG